MYIVSLNYFIIIFYFFVIIISSYFVNVVVNSRFVRYFYLKCCVDNSF